MRVRRGVPRKGLPEGGGSDKSSARCQVSSAQRPPADDVRYLRSRFSNETALFGPHFCTTTANYPFSVQARVGSTIPFMRQHKRRLNRCLLLALSRRRDLLVTCHLSAHCPITLYLFPGAGGGVGGALTFCRRDRPWFLRGGRPRAPGTVPS